MTYAPSWTRIFRPEGRDPITSVTSAVPATASIMQQSKSRRSLLSWFGAPKLSAVMVVLFICLSIPILIFIMLYNYQTTSTSIIKMLDQAVAKTADVSIENAKNLFDPIAGTLRLLALIAGSNPALFRTEESNEL